MKREEWVYPLKTTLKDMSEHYITLFRKRCCPNLADPEDRSRYAGYEMYSGHCSWCKEIKYISDIITKIEEIK